MRVHSLVQTGDGWIASPVNESVEVKAKVVAPPEKKAPRKSTGAETKEL